MRDWAHYRVDYRWFPEGKIVFVAPTKPLVAQQIGACHETCGIPGSDAAELTGQIARETRALYVILLLSFSFLANISFSGRRNEYFI